MLFGMVITQTVHQNKTQKNLQNNIITKPLNQNSMEKELDIDIALLVLEEYQEWRIGEVDELTQTPEMITKAIDSILIYFKSE